MNCDLAIKTLLRNRIITPPEAVRLLKQVGYTADDEAEHMVANWLVPSVSTYTFYRTLTNGSQYVLGTAEFYPSTVDPGWTFFPMVAGRKPSRKRYAEMEECLPRWLGYPDRCESKEGRHVAI